MGHHLFEDPQIPTADEDQRLSVAATTEGPQARRKPETMGFNGASRPSHLISASLPKEDGI